MMAWIVAIWQYLRSLGATINRINQNVEAAQSQLTIIQSEASAANIKLDSIETDLAQILKILTTPDDVAGFDVTTSNPVKQ